jgi:hypothetical protein
VATHNVYFTEAPGGIYYAFPADQSLSTWTTFRVAFSEGSNPDTGRYSGTVDDANGSLWYVFSGASQPSHWGQATATFDADIQAGVTIPVVQVPVPASRTWVLKQTGDGLRGELPIVRSVGDSQLYACDFRHDLPNNGRLISLDSIAVEGTENGISIDSQDQGVDRSAAKFKIEALIAGTYVITVTASYDDSDGGGVSIGDVTLIVK